MNLVTGGTGLVGSHVLIELVRKNEPVRALRRNQSDLEQVKNLFQFYGIENKFSSIEWVTGDILDIFSLEDALEGVTKVYHCAAIVSFEPRDRDLLQKVNATGTANVVNACLDANVKKLCHVSSTAAIGRKKDSEIIDEKTQWKNTPENSWYAISKYNAEREVWRGIEEGLPAVIVNPCVVIGPGNWNLSSCALFKTVHDGLRYYTEGGNAFVDVRDVARAMVQLMESEITDERFLVTGENLKFRELTDMIADAFGKKKPSVRISKFWSGFGWRMEKIISRLTGRRPRITKETARASHRVYKYNHSKLEKKLNFHFTPVKSAVENAVKYFEKIRT